MNLLILEKDFQKQLKKILNNILISKSIFAFDFDGVVVNSMYLKGKIFAKIFNVNNYNKKKNNYISFIKWIYEEKKKNTIYC